MGDFAIGDYSGHRERNTAPGAFGLDHQASQHKVPAHIWLTREFRNSSPCKFNAIRGFHTKCDAKSRFPRRANRRTGGCESIFLGVNRYDNNHFGGNNGMSLAVRTTGLQAATTGTVPAWSVRVPKGCGCGNG